VFVTEDAPSPENPLHAKGIGEIGLIAVGAAVAAAIDDALRDGIHVDRLPVRPQQIHERCQALHKPADRLVRAGSTTRSDTAE